MNSIMSDPVALQLFIWVLTNVDKDTGKVDFGRFYVARQLRVNPNTLYSALKRLVSKYKVCEISSTAEYTTIRLLNWAKYQPSKEDINTSVNNSSTTTQQPVNTLQEERIENRDINNNDEKSSDELSELKKSLGIPNEPSKNINYEFQAQAMEIIEALGVPDKRKSAYFKAAKEEPRNHLLDAYSFAVDHPTYAARDKMFFWKLNDLRKEKNAASN